MSFPEHFLWGGAVSAYGSLREFSHQENENRQMEEKRAIARRLAKSRQRQRRRNEP